LKQCYIQDPDQFFQISKLVDFFVADKIHVRVSQTVMIEDTFGLEVAVISLNKLAVDLGLLCRLLLDVAIVGFG
jgi:hypothetical protein